MDILRDLLGTWSGLLTVLVIAFSAFAIPAGVIFALNREIKGPAELKAEAHDRELAKGHH